MSLARVIAFIRLGRPHFLVGGFVLYGLGAAIARALGHPVDAPRYALGQAAVTAFQLMTHYANEYFDHEADRANTTPTRFSGGSRVLPGGALAPAVALTAAVVLAAIGVALTGVIAVVIDLPTARIAVPVLSATFVLAWSYSAPPLRLCAVGAGELATALVVTGLVPVLGFALQARGLDHLRVVVIAIAPLACLQLAMMLAIEVPDAASDAATGKRTLVVRLGAARASWLHAAVVVIAFVVVGLLPELGVPGRLARGALVLAPVAVSQIVRFHRAAGAPASWERLALWSVILLVGASIAELAAFLYARPW